MNRRNIKLLALVLSLIMLTSVIFTSCTPKTDNSEGTADVTTPSGTLEPTKTETPFISNGITEFKIIRPEKTSQSVIDAAVLVRKKISDHLTDGISGIKLSDDFVKRDETISPDEKVVLVGLTNREESSKAFENLALGEYRVTIINGKLCIAAYTDAALTRAVNDLSRLINDGIDENKSYTLPAELLIEGQIEGSVFANVPMVLDSSVTAVHDMGDECQLFVADNATPAKFDDYKQKLKDRGFSEYSTNTLGKNFYATYVNDTVAVNAYYIDYSEEIRVTAEPLQQTGLPTREADNKYTAVTTPLVTQIGVERVGNTDKYQNGMSYVFRLSDGSFIIYDGGFSNSNTDGRKLNDVMVEQAPDPNKITIAAWIITHAHGDHYGGFIAFNNLYSPNSSNSRYTIEQVIRNTPTTEDSAGASNTSTEKQVNVEKILKSRGVTLIKSHPGQEYYIRDAKITVLYNLEMFVPGSFTYFNTSTTVTKLELAGQSYMMLGDCSEDGSRILCKAYDKDIMMCDFVQVAHHGYTGGTTALYTLIDPTYVLWPMGNGDYASYKNNPRSNFLITSPKVVGIYQAGHTKKVFSLPFNGSNCTSTDYT